MLSWIEAPRILVMGLGDVLRGDEGIGVHLCRSLRKDLTDVDLLEPFASDMDFLQAFEEYELVILIDAVCMTDEPGQVFVISPYSLVASKRGACEQERALDRALESCRLYGHRVPPVEVIGVCIPEADVPGDGLSNEMKAKYDSILTRVRAIVAALVRRARSTEPGAPSQSEPTGGSPRAGSRGPP